MASKTQMRKETLVHMHNLITKQLPPSDTQSELAALTLILLKLDGVAPMLANSEVQC